MMNKYSGFGGNTSSRFGQEMANRNMEEDEEERMRRLRSLFSGRYMVNKAKRKTTSTSVDNGGSGGGTGVDDGGGYNGGGDRGRGGNDRLL